MNQVLSYFMSSLFGGGCHNFVASTRQVMNTVKTIAIVGATGKMGSAIARSLRRKYRLLLASRDEAKLVDLKYELSMSAGPEVYAVSCARDAAWEADIIIIATPHKAEREVADKIQEVAVGKIVISISNPFDDFNNAPVKSDETSAAETLQKLLPYSKIVKTFNTTFAEDFINTIRDGKKVDAFIAGNNSDAVETVSEVVASAGFTPVVVGDLTMSRTLESMQLMLVKLTIKNNLQPRNGFKRMRGF